MNAIQKLLLPALLLAGCNSTETSTVTQSIPASSTITSAGATTITQGVSGPQYETLESTKAGVTTLAGTSSTITSAGGVSINSSKGTFNRSNGAIQVNDSAYNLIDSDGFSSGQASDGTAALFLVSTGNNYKYMRAYGMTYPDGGGTTNVTGIFGNPTRTEDLPSSGTASFSGESTMGYGNKTGVPFVQTANGTASISADFANGTVDVESRYVFFKDSSGGTVFNPAFDKIERTGMQINGGTFLGGTAVFTKNGTVVDPIGANAQDQASGQFYGGELGNGSSRPAEAGGVSVVEGDDGIVSNIFLGD